MLANLSVSSLCARPTSTLAAQSLKGTLSQLTADASRLSTMSSTHIAYHALARTNDAQNPIFSIPSRKLRTQHSQTEPISTPIAHST